MFAIRSKFARAMVLKKCTIMDREIKGAQARGTLEKCAAVSKGCIYFYFFLHRLLSMSNSIRMKFPGALKPFSLSTLQYFARASKASCSTRTRLVTSTIRLTDYQLKFHIGEAISNPHFFLVQAKQSAAQGIQPNLNLSMPKLLRLHLVFCALLSRRTA